MLPVIDIRSSGSRAAGEASAFALDPPSAVVLQLRISKAGCEAPTSYHCWLQLGLFRAVLRAPLTVIDLGLCRANFFGAIRIGVDKALLAAFNNDLNVPQKLKYFHLLLASWLLLTALSAM